MSEVERLREENAKLRSQLESLEPKSHKTTGPCSRTELGDLGLFCVKNHNLSNTQIQRYSRQLILPRFGIEGKEQHRQYNVLLGSKGLGVHLTI